MSLKNWIKQIETSQLNEFAPPQGAVAIPGVQGQGQVSPTFLAPTNASDKATADLIKALASNKKITTIGQQQPATGAKPTTTSQQSQTPQQTVAGTTTVAGNSGLQEDDLTEVAPPGMEDVVKALKKKFPNQAGKAYAIAWDQYNKQHGKTEESVMESKQLNEGTLDEILENHRYEHKMCQEGWGMDNSLYEALADHYFKEGRIPRSVWHGSAEELREFVEDCYAKDTMVVGEGLGGAVAGGTIGAVVGGPVGALRGASIGSEVQDMVSEKGMMESSEQSKRIEAHGVHGMKSKPWRKTFKNQEAFEKWFEKNEGNVEVHGTREIEESVAEGSKEDFTMNARQADPRLDKYATDPKKSFLDKASDALTKAGSAVMNRLHPSDDELRSGPLKETKEDEMFESKKSIRESEERSYVCVHAKKGKCEVTASSSYGAAQAAAKKWGLKSTAGIDAYLADKTHTAVDESVTKNDKGLKHKADAGGYGRKHDGDEKPAKGAKKDSEDTGSKFDSSELTKAIGGKKPEKEIGKLSVKKRVKTKADSEEVDEALKGDQEKLDINKNGKLDGADFAMLRGQKKKDTQMESWDAQLKNLLTEGMTVSTSVGNEGGQDSVTITANDADAHKLLQILQNAGMSSGVPGSVLSSPVAPVQATTGATSPAPATTTTGGNAADENIEGSGSNVSSMPMPRGMAFSVQPEETEIPTAPEELGVTDSEDIIASLGKEQSQSEKTDNGDDTLSFLKKAIGHGTEYADGGKQGVTTENTPTPTSPAVSQAAPDEEVTETDEDGEDDSSEDDDSKEEYRSDDEESDEEKVDESKETCNECGGLMEDEHECDVQLNEWSNSPQGQSEDEQFTAEMEYMQNIISGGLNKKKIDQTVMPHTKVKVTESTITSQLRKLAGI